MPGRSVTRASGWLRMRPSLRSTVTPGKLPTCWLEPVSWLKRVVLPQFWLPARAKVSGAPLALGSPTDCQRYSRSCRSPLWEPSPSSGCGVRPVAVGLARSGMSVSWTERSMICAASALRRVSS